MNRLWIFAWFEAARVPLGLQTSWFRILMAFNEKTSPGGGPIQFISLKEELLDRGSGIVLLIHPTETLVC